MFSPEIIRTATGLLDRARDKNIRLTTAESCTGGLIIGALTEIAGSSAVVDRGFISYSNDAKQAMLGVTSALLDKDGAVSAACAIAMAEGALAASFADFALSVTGIAGPDGGSPDKPVGLVHMACACHGGLTRHQKHLFPDQGRASIREATILAGLKLFRDCIG